MAQDPIRGWLQHQQRRNLSTASIRRRRLILRRLERWADDRGLKLLWLTTDQLHDWLDSLSVAPQSKGHYIGDLASFYGWVTRVGFRPDDPTETIDRPRRPRYLPRPIDDEALHHAIEEASPTLRIVLCLASLAGLRIAEVAGLDVADVSWPAALIFVRQGKGNRDRIVPMHDRLHDEIKRYGPPRHGPLVHHDGNAYKPGSLSAMVSRHMRALGIDATAHSLRHWFATKAYGGTGDIRAVQDLLGHASLSTTQVYTALNPEAARAAVEGIEPAR